MKKVISVVAVVAMLFALSVSAFADEAVSSVENNSSSGVTTPETYVDSPNRLEEDDVTVDENSENVILENGETATVVLSETGYLTTEQKTSLKAAVDEEGNEAAAEVIDVNLIDKDGNAISAEEFPAEGVTVVFVRDDNAKVVKVLYWNDETGAWDEATDVHQVSTASGTEVTATFANFCTVAFLTNGIYTDETGGETGDDNTGDDNTGDDNTGDDNTGDDNTGDDNTGDNNQASGEPADDNTGDDDTDNGASGEPSDGNGNQPSGGNGNQPSGGPGGQPSGKGAASPQTGYNTAVWAAVAVVLVLAAGVCFVSARKKVKE